MKRVLAIFRKDVRRLWPQLAVFAALLIGFGATDTEYSPRSDAATLAMLLLPVFCLLVAMASIHEEAPASDDAYWRTRPFTWRDVLAAKVLFLAVCVQLPVFLLQAAVLELMGFPPWEHLDVLLARQFFTWAILVLPAAALGVVTKSTGRGMLAAGGLWLMLSLLGRFLFGGGDRLWGELVWIPATAFALIAMATAAAVLLLAYFRRRIAGARVAMGCGLVVAALALMVPPQQAAFTLLARVTGGATEASTLRIAPDEGPRQGTFFSSPEPDISLGIAVRVEGLPANRHIDSIWVRTRLEGQCVPGWDSGWRSRGGLHNVAEGKGLLTLHVDQAVYRACRGTKVHLSGQLDLTVFAPIEPVRCVEIAELSRCVAPYPRAAQLSSKSGYAPYSTSLSFSILSNVASGGSFWETRIWLRPVAYVERPFDFGTVNLDQWVRGAN